MQQYEEEDGSTRVEYYNHHQYKYRITAEDCDDEDQEKYIPSSGLYQHDQCHHHHFFKANGDEQHSQQRQIQPEHYHHNRTSARSKIDGDNSNIHMAIVSQENHCFDYGNPDDGDDDDDDMSADSSSPTDVSADIVLERIETMMIQTLLERLENGQVPSIDSRTFSNTNHCRTLTSLYLVSSFCYELLKSYRSTTTREVYYYYVTHFKNQTECDKAIWDLSTILQVPRSSLGLVASPKGWFCGCVDLYNNDRNELTINGRELDIHGMAITAAFLSPSLFKKNNGSSNNTDQCDWMIRSHDAKCILVIEKEGVYTRLSEDKFFLKYFPCIMVTGKGFPDVATRQLVHHLQQSLDLPVYGLCDCNPYGISVLNTYRYGQVRTRTNSRRKMTPEAASKLLSSSSSSTAWDSSCRQKKSKTTKIKKKKRRSDMQWIGLRPSQVTTLDLPSSVFQKFTELDKKRLKSLQHESHPFHQQGYNPKQRHIELALFEAYQFKVELEALNWKGMDYLCQWLHSILKQHEEEEEVKKLAIISSPADDANHDEENDDDKDRQNYLAII